LGEIEQNLKRHDSIEQTVVIVREDTAGDARLVAYMVPKNGQTIADNALRDHLKQSLPYYMVPQHFVTLESMPQTNNGKIDYRALPAPVVEAAPKAGSVELAMPETQAEKYLAGVWEQVLEIEDVERNDLFFDIGGHSLLVMQVITTVHEKTGIKLGPQDFLIATLEQMAGKIEPSHAFQSVQKPSVTAEPVATAPPIAAAPSANSEQSKPLADPKPEKRSGFRKLTGFWN
jgi:acyl carrier protein